jgi:DNA-binding IclR family transcriptional regulator
MHATHFPGSHLGTDFIGDTEGRPMTASKLAAYLDKPRATVTRKLGVLCKQGAIVMNRGHYEVSAETLTRPGPSTTRRIRTVIEAAAKLSKMDTLPKGHRN